MRKITFLLLLSLTVKFSAGQDNREQIQRACLDYLEGFYEGDTAKLVRSLKPSLYKFGYWRNKTTGNYDADGQMTYRQALDFANNVMAKKTFAKPDAPKKVEVLDIMNTMAAAKVTAWWGVDYILLARQDGQWKIEQVLWEGPLDK